MTNALIIPALPKSLALPGEAPRAEYEQRNPALAYLERLAPSGRKAQANYLSMIAGGRMSDENGEGIWPTRYTIATAPWHTIRPENVKRIKSLMIAAGKKNSTVNAVLSALRGVAGESYDLGLISSDVLTGIQRVKNAKGNDKEKKATFTEVEMNRLFQVCVDDVHKATGLRDRVFIALCMLEGMRATEALGIKLSDFNADYSEVRITRKGGGVQVLPLTEKTTAFITEFLQVRSTAPGHLICRIRKGGYIFFGGISYKAADNRFKQRATEAGISEQRSHAMRKTFATENTRRGVDVNVTQYRMGHKNINTTMIYVAEVVNYEAAVMAAREVDITKKIRKPYTYKHKDTINETEETDSTE